MAELSTTSLFSDANLVSYYRYEDNVNDSKGSNNGSATSITYSTGKYRKAATFNGTSSGIRITTTSALNVTTGNFSISSWINPTNFSAARRIYSKQGNQNTNQFGILQFSTNTSSKLIGSFRNNTSGTSYSITSNADLVASTWQHVVLTRSGTTFALYINGKLDKSETLGSVSNLSSDSSASFGAYWDDGSSTFSAGWWLGMIDDFAFFNRTLTGGEVFSIYQDGAPLFFSQL
jgi:hypothetical protein